MPRVCSSLNWFWAGRWWPRPSTTRSVEAGRRCGRPCSTPPRSPPHSPPPPTRYPCNPVPPPTAAPATHSSPTTTVPSLPACRAGAAPRPALLSPPQTLSPPHSPLSPLSPLPLPAPSLSMSHLWVVWTRPAPRPARLPGISCTPFPSPQPKSHSLRPLSPPLPPAFHLIVKFFPQNPRNSGPSLLVLLP